MGGQNESLSARVDNARKTKIPADEMRMKYNSAYKKHKRLLDKVEDLHDTEWFNSEETNQKVRLETAKNYTEIMKGTNDPVVRKALHDAYMDEVGKSYDYDPGWPPFEGPDLTLIKVEDSGGEGSGPPVAGAAPEAAPKKKIDARLNALLNDVNLNMIDAPAPLTSLTSYPEALAGKSSADVQPAAGEQVGHAYDGYQAYGQITGALGSKGLIDYDSEMEAAGQVTDLSSALMFAGSGVSEGLASGVMAGMGAAWQGGLQTAFENGLTRMSKGRIGKLGAAGLVQGAFTLYEVTSDPKAWYEASIKGDIWDKAVGAGGAFTAADAAFAMAAAQKDETTALGLKLEGAALLIDGVAGIFDTVKGVLELLSNVCFSLAVVLAVIAIVAMIFGGAGAALLPMVGYLLKAGTWLSTASGLAGGVMKLMRSLAVPMHTVSLLLVHANPEALQLVSAHLKEDLELLVKGYTLNTVARFGEDAADHATMGKKARAQVRAEKAEAPKTTFKQKVGSEAAQFVGLKGDMGVMTQGKRLYDQSTHWRRDTGDLNAGIQEQYDAMEGGTEKIKGFFKKKGAGEGGDAAKAKAGDGDTSAPTMKPTDGLPPEKKPDDVDTSEQKPGDQALEDPSVVIELNKAQRQIMDTVDQKFDVPELSVKAERALSRVPEAKAKAIQNKHEASTGNVIQAFNDKVSQAEANFTGKEGQAASVRDLKLKSTLKRKAAGDLSQNEAYSLRMQAVQQYQREVSQLGWEKASTIANAKRHAERDIAKVYGHTEHEIMRSVGRKRSGLFDHRVMVDDDQAQDRGLKHLQDFAGKGKDPAGAAGRAGLDQQIVDLLQPETKKEVEAKPKASPTPTLSAAPAAADKQPGADKEGAEPKGGAGGLAGVRAQIDGLDGQLDDVAARTVADKTTATANTKDMINGLHKVSLDDKGFFLTEAQKERGRARAQRLQYVGDRNEMAYYYHASANKEANLDQLQQSMIGTRAVIDSHRADLAQREGALNKGYKEAAGGEAVASQGLGLLGGFILSLIENFIQPGITQKLNVNDKEAQKDAPGAKKATGAAGALDQMGKDPDSLTQGPQDATTKAKEALGATGDKQKEAASGIDETEAKRRWLHEDVSASLTHTKAEQIKLLTGMQDMDRKISSEASNEQSQRALYDTAMGEMGAWAAQSEGRKETANASILQVHADMQEQERLEAERKKAKEARKRLIREMQVEMYSNPHYYGP
jgi:hypothetical protein